MATMTQERFIVTLPGDVSAFMRRRAEAGNTTVERALERIAIALMEDEEDEMTEEEERRLSDLIEERMRTTTRFIPHDEFWKAVNAL